MPFTIYQLAVPPAVRALRNLRAILEKAKAHAAERKIDESAFIGSRLYPDMLPFSFQVQVATDIARGGIARVAGLEPPKYEDNETTFDQLIARVDRAIAEIQAIDRDKVEGGESRSITRPVRGQPHTFTAQNFLQQHMLPNVYFHVATAYGLLRHGGVDLGKRDYLGSFD
jgi:hypothetical protein